MADQSLIEKFQDPYWRLSNLYKIKSKDGKIVNLVPNGAQQQFLDEEGQFNVILKARQLGFCAEPSQKILTADLKWVTLDDVKIGQEIVCVDEESPKGRGNSRKMRKGIVEDKREVFEEAFELTMSNGETLIATGPHKFLSKRRGGSKQIWRSVEKTKVGDAIRFITKPWGERNFEDGWFAGMIDGEGSMALRKSTGAEVNVAQVEGDVLERMRAYLKLRNYTYREEWDNRTSENSSKFGDRPVVKVVVSRMNEVFRLMGHLRPERFKDRDWWEGKGLPGKKTGVAYATVLAIKPLGVRRMIDLQTSEKTFIVEGFVSHNSTLCLMRLLDKAMFNENTTCVVVAHTREAVTKLFRMIKFAYEHYPNKYPKPKAKYNTKTDLEFEEINSRIYVATSVRGDTIDHLHISEMAFMDSAEDKFIATSAAVTPRGTVTIESTANGVGDFFYDFYNVAEEKEYKAHFFPWFLADEYKREAIGFEANKLQLALKERYSLTDEQLSWHSHMTKLLGAKFKQEYPMNAQEAFIAAGGNVFPIEELDKMIPKKPLVRYEAMCVWQHPEYQHKYCMGVDTAEGINKDESSIDIVDLDTGEQVWHWSGHCPVPLLAEKVEIYAKKYNNAFIIPESNNHGFSLIYLLQNKRLNIYKREKFDGPTVKRIDRLGWQTTRRTKPLMIQSLILAIHEKDIQINHKKTIAQMKTFITDPESGSMKAAHGKLDDGVISLALAWQGIRTNTGPARKAINTFDFTKGDSSSMISY